MNGGDERRGGGENLGMILGGGDGVFAFFVVESLCPNDHCTLQMEG